MKQNKIPEHVGIIMDGNRRWARKRGLSAVKGHAYAVDTVTEELIERAGERGVKYLTLWAFSTENWNRDKQEVEGLMKLFRKALVTKVERFIEKGARLQLIGDMSRFPEDIRKGMEEAIEKSSSNNKIVVTFALNYGGRDEIVRAVNKLVGEGEKIDEEGFSKLLDTAEMPDPDLIIRTGGEKRLSGFLPWQGTYAELLFVDTLFPDFGPDELDKAIEEYQGRQRRFGK